MARPISRFFRTGAAAIASATLQVEGLVSHGYIVAAIDHPYAASGVVLPDGRLATFDSRMADRAFLDSMIPYLARDLHGVPNRRALAWR